MDTGSKNGNTGDLESQQLTYRDAGVDIDAGNRAVEMMKHSVRSTYRPEDLGDQGGLGGLFALDTTKFAEPVLVSGTDGVGTKLKVAFMLDRHDTIGQDLVAMCVNDVLVQGAEPLFFLDYLATGRIIPERVAAIVGGIAAACREAGCALIGGETAEMPGFYAAGEYDLAGFAVGVVERSRLITGAAIAPGDVLLGLPSSGLHSNGYSLARKICFERRGLRPEDYIPELGRTIGEELLTPTRLYPRLLLPVIASFPVKGLVHVTGGGFIDNIPRILPPGRAVVVDAGSWMQPAVFRLIQAWGNVPWPDMFRTFNMGIGMIVFLAPDAADEVESYLASRGEAVWRIGRVTEGKGEVVLRGGVFGE